MLILPLRPRRAPAAWGQNRNTSSPGPGFSTNAANRSPANGFPPLGAQSTAKSTSTPNAWGSAEDKQQLLAGLAGSIVSTVLFSDGAIAKLSLVLTCLSCLIGAVLNLAFAQCRIKSSPYLYERTRAMKALLHLSRHLHLTTRVCLSLMCSNIRSWTLT